MITESSDQVPRTTLLKRFPMPKNFGVAAESRIERGKNVARTSRSSARKDVRGLSLQP
jgi:succinate dehydrogenase / fumarate reductase iron-sulfur subunit